MKKNDLMYLYTALSIAKLCYSATEILQNNNFESSSFHGNWYCRGGCSLTLSSDSYEGSHSAKVSHRDHRWKGLHQDLPNVQGGKIYKLTAYMKLLNVGSGHMYEEVETIVSCTTADGHQKFNYWGSVPMVQASNEWYEVGGVKQLPQGSHSCRMYFQTSAGVDYLVDKASMTEVVPNSNWKTQANIDIDRIRKSNITLSLTGHDVGSSSLDIELVQTKHEFGFGCAMRANQIVEPTQTNYLNAFVDNFEWAVPVNFLKWYTMEYNRGHINYNTALTAINTLRSKGIKVRGHNVFWGSEDHIQPWVKALSQHDLLIEMDKRIKGVIGHTKGLLEHWDVNNENLHGDFYERQTGNKNITMDMFQQVHAVDNHPKLFLNEYGIVVNANKAVALKDQAKRFRAAGVPIYGVGIQSHLPGRVDITGLRARLDIVAEAGLPIWITELTVSAGGDILRASTLSDVLHLYFSHPSVEGVLLWGFWDGEIHDKNAALFHGPNVTVCKTIPHLEEKKMKNKVPTVSAKMIKEFDEIELKRPDAKEDKLVTKREETAAPRAFKKLSITESQVDEFVEALFTPTHRRNVSTIFKLRRQSSADQDWDIVEGITFSCAMADARVATEPQRRKCSLSKNIKSSPDILGSSKSEPPSKRCSRMLKDLDIL